jgi:hypothetical protein
VYDVIYKFEQGASVRIYLLGLIEKTIGFLLIIK